MDEREKLARLAIRAGDEPDEAFALKLEKFCDAEGALSSDFGPHSISPIWTGQDGDFEQMGAKMSCLNAAGTASDFQIGFIGNEKYREDDSGSGD